MTQPLPTIPIECLHLETGVVLLFLAMVVRTQFDRAADPDYDAQRGLPFLRWLPLFFVLTGSVFFALLRHTSPLLGVELAAGIALSLLHPANALCFMLHLSVLRPWEIESGNPVLTLMPRLAIWLCIFSWLIHRDQHARVSWRDVRGVRFLVGFAAWVLISTIKAPDMIASMADWFGTFSAIFTVFGLTLFLITSERCVRQVQLTLAISSLSLIANGIYQFFSGGLTLESGRLQSSGMLGDPNDMGALVVMALPFALAPVFEETSGALTKASGLFYAASAAVLVWLTRSRGTMLALVAQFLVVRLVRSKRSRMSLILTTVLAGAGYMGLMSLVPRAAEDMEGSQNGRLTFWKAAANIAVKNPLFGVGFGQFSTHYESYIVGPVTVRGKRTAHSSWFLALAESGFVGFFLFCAFFASVVRVAWRDRARRPGQLYALGGYGVAMSFLSHTYTSYYYVLMALILASAGLKGKVHDGA